MQLWTNSDKSEYAIYLKDTSSKGSKNIKNKDKSPITTTASNNNLLAATNHDNSIKYTELLDESNYLEDLKYDWKYTLERWIHNSNNNYNHDFKAITEASLTSSSASPSILIFSHTEGAVVKQQQQQQQDDSNNNFIKGKDIQQRSEEVFFSREHGNRSSINKIIKHRNFKLYRIKKKNNKKIVLKRCHFCKLEYLTNKERVEHERIWHANLVSSK
jgi:hypothetical protein